MMGTQMKGMGQHPQINLEQTKSNNNLGMSQMK